MLKTIALLLLFFTAMQVHAEKLKVDITISKDRMSSKWVVNYAFSEKVSSVNFEKTPYSFIHSDWSVSNNNTVLDLSSLQVNFKSEDRHLLINLAGENDQFIRGFYTPFLNFSDGSNAVFVGHYVPLKVRINGEWIGIEDIAITLTIKSGKSDHVLLSGLNKVENLKISNADTRQYAYIGKLAAKAFEKFNIVLDPQLPEWMREAYLKATPEFFHYYETNTQAELSFSPLFIVNFKANNKWQSLDGGAINKQIAINATGDGWQQTSAENRYKLLRILAHEMAHLWNSQHWKSANFKQVWLHEGGANYFSQNALLDLGYIKKENYTQHYQTQAKKCVKALNNNSVAQLKKRADAYICGEVLYQLGSLMLGNTHNLEIWNKIVSNHSTLRYSEADFIQALHNANVNKVDIAAIENILFGKGTNELSELLDKYNNK